MVMLCVVCGWHALIAICPSNVAPYWDMIAFISLAVIYTLFHLVFFLWMYFVVKYLHKTFVIRFSLSIDISTTKNYAKKR